MYRVCMYCCSLCCMLLIMLFSSFLLLVFIFFCFKQKTAYEMRISDWSSDVCSSDLGTHIDRRPGRGEHVGSVLPHHPLDDDAVRSLRGIGVGDVGVQAGGRTHQSADRAPVAGGGPAGQAPALLDAHPRQIGRAHV